jgi:CO/xanthine dehydrogenase Mo-binding subunit/aerobic-type carbon monoxide dehydrogenase small subunit (CoxS/CutS family)
VSASVPLRFTVNGVGHALETDGRRRLVDVLREDLGLTGTKVGCNAGDCGACTVRLDGEQVCSCLVPVGQVDGRDVATVEGLAGSDGSPSPLQRAFLACGGSQCGACTPGMLMAADDLLDRTASPTGAEILDGLGGVLCRCTGYTKIVEAVAVAAHSSWPSASSASSASVSTPAPGGAVGARIERLDGLPKVTGAERFADDVLDTSALTLRVIRSPHARATFELGDLRAFVAAHPGVVRVLTSDDVPVNRYGIYDTGKDQPVLADDHVRYAGEAVVALLGDAGVVAAIRDEDLPITWHPQPPVVGIAGGLAPGAPLLHEDLGENVLVRGRVARGDVDRALAASAATATGLFETSFVEHAYIEPEAGTARVVDGRVEVWATTQTPYMDRDELALILGLPKDRVRVIPSACGGGFGGKLDLSIQPLLAIGALVTGRPVRGVYSRPESMRATTKRHPARIEATFGADAAGRLTGVRFHGDFDTGAYASWGPTVANRVPVHAMGPYAVAAVEATTAAIHTNGPPAGAFRGFGVPQAAIAHEALLDDLAEQLGIDELEIRRRNALRAGSVTGSGQVLAASAGLGACLDALAPRWAALRAESIAFNAEAAGSGDPRRLGVGIGAMWYGIGNTSLPNPSTVELGIERDGTVRLFSGATDIGQGSATVVAQIAADSFGVPVDALALTSPDTDLTPDAGKTSASRQTFVSGNAARLAGEALRRRVLELAEASEAAVIEVAAPGTGDGRLRVRDGDAVSIVELHELPVGGRGCVLLESGTYDPRTTELDADGQGIPYETYGFGAQVALVEVDTDLGTVRVSRIVAAHDVGRAINPTLVEGQVQGGIAQGIGMALMEAYEPGRTDNLHDYLIPTVGDAPAIDVLLVEDPEPSGPYGAKGVGEPALVPTAPAILGAIRHATGARVRSVPATPARVLAGIREAQAGRTSVRG